MANKAACRLHMPGKRSVVLQEGPGRAAASKGGRQQQKTDLETTSHQAHGPYQDSFLEAQMHISLNWYLEHQAP